MTHPVDTRYLDLAKLALKDHPRLARHEGELADVIQWHIEGFIERQGNASTHS
jgi:hypothetical protein